MPEYEDVLARIGQNINRLRKEKGFSFQELAHRSDVEKPNLIEITGKGRNVTIKTLCKIANALEVEMEELMGKG